MPNPSVRAVASATASFASSVTVSVPTGTTNGDGMLLTVYSALNATSLSTATTPSGWTLIDSAQSDIYSGWGTWTSTYYRVASSEPANYTITFSATTDQLEASITTIQDIKSGTWIGATAVNNGTGTTTTYSGITATANSLIYIQSNDWWGAGGLTPPTGFTERYDGAFYVATQANMAAGATGNWTQTNSNHIGADIWRSHTIEVLAATGNTAGTLASSGVNTTTWVGNSKKAGSLATAGINTTTWVGKSRASGVWSASGVGTFSGSGRYKVVGTLIAAGVGVASWIGNRTIRASFTMAGVGAFIGVGNSKKSGTLNAAGVGAFNAVGNAKASGTLNATGTSTLLFRIRDASGGPTAYWRAFKRLNDDLSRIFNRGGLR